MGSEIRDIEGIHENRDPSGKSRTISFAVAVRGNDKEPEGRVDTCLAPGPTGHVLLQPASGGWHKEAGLSPVVVWVHHAGKESPGEE